MLFIRRSTARIISTVYRISPRLSSCITTKGYIKAKYAYHHGELIITIEDTGKGHSRKEMKQIFERFARDADSKHYGTGLEMPIIKEIVNQMGGTVELQSEESGGNTIYVIIPCQMSSMEKKTEII